MDYLQVKRLPDGGILARRVDGKPLSPQDRERVVRRMVRANKNNSTTSTEKPDGEREIMPISILAENGGKERLCCRFCKGNHFWQSISSVINCANCSLPVSPILVGKWIET